MHTNYKVNLWYNLEKNWNSFFYYQQKSPTFFLGQTLVEKILKAKKEKRKKCVLKRLVVLFLAAVIFNPCTMLSFQGFFFTLLQWTLFYGTENSRCHKITAPFTLHKQYRLMKHLVLYDYIGNGDRVEQTN